jgi:hypothetical protein
MRIDEEDDGGGSGGGGGCVGVRHQNEREEELDGEEFLSGRKLVQLLDSTYISSFHEVLPVDLLKRAFQLFFSFYFFFFTIDSRTKSELGFRKK